MIFLKTADCTRTGFYYAPSPVPPSKKKLKRGLKMQHPTCGHRTVGALPTQKEKVRNILKAINTATETI